MKEKEVFTSLTHLGIIALALLGVKYLVQEPPQPQIIVVEPCVREVPTAIVIAPVKTSTTVALITLKEPDEIHRP